MKTAYQDFRTQHPYPPPQTAPYITHRLERRTHPPLDRPGPAPNTTTGPKQGQTHADHRHPPRGKVAHTQEPHDRPGPTGGPPHLPSHAARMLGLRPQRTHHTLARITPHSTPPNPPHSPPTTTGLRMGGPIVPPRRHKPHSGVEPRPQIPMALHHNAHLAPPPSRRNCNSLQHARTRQNEQARAPLSSPPPLVPHTRPPNTNSHMLRPEPGHSLHPPLHRLLPHTRATRTGTNSNVPPRETHHLERNRAVRHPHPAAQKPQWPTSPQSSPYTPTCQ